MSRAQDPVAGEPSTRWFVLIEETTGSGQSQRWRLTRRWPFPDRATARREADTAAAAYRPEHPKREQSRMVFQTGDDVWTVWVEGAYTPFHFRVSVACQKAQL